jgi:phospholipid/cholesterol/gamma-HCH transport system substrate-binding protein
MSARFFRRRRPTVDGERLLLYLFRKCAMAKSIKVGIFVVFGLVLATIAVFTIGGNQRMWESKITYRAAFKDVGGLKTAAPVRMGGIDIGIITGVGHAADANDSNIYVKMSIVKREAERIRQDTVASIVNKGLLGDKMVELSSDGKLGPLDPEKAMATEEPMDFTRYAAKFDEIAQKADRAMTNIDRITEAVGDPKFADDLKGTVANIHQILDGVANHDGAAHRLIFDPKEAERLDHLIANLDGTSAHLNAITQDFGDVSAHVKSGPGLLHALVYDGDLSQEAGGALLEVHRDLSAIRQGNGLAHAIIYGDSDSQHVMGNIEAMTDDMRTLVANVKAGKGTVGAFLVDPSVYEDVKSLVGNVERNEVLRALVRYSIKEDEAKPALRVEPKAAR